MAAIGDRLHAIREGLMVLLGRRDYPVSVELIEIPPAPEDAEGSLDSRPWEEGESAGAIGTHGAGFWG
jgi:hypothetical protein